MASLRHRPPASHPLACFSSSPAASSLSRPRISRHRLRSATRPPRAPARRKLLVRASRATPPITAAHRPSACATRRKAPAGAQPLRAPSVLSRRASLSPRTSTRLRPEACPPILAHSPPIFPLLPPRDTEPREESPPLVSSCSTSPPVDSTPPVPSMSASASMAPSYRSPAWPVGACWSTARMLLTVNTISATSRRSCFGCCPSSCTRRAPRT